MKVLGVEICYCPLCHCLDDALICHFLYKIKTLIDFEGIFFDILKFLNFPKQYHESRKLLQGV